MQLTTHLNLDWNTFSASSGAKGPSSFFCPLLPTLQPQLHVRTSERRTCLQGQRQASLADCQECESRGHAKKRMDKS